MGANILMIPDSDYIAMMNAPQIKFSIRHSEDMLLIEQDLKDLSISMREVVRGDNDGR